MSGTLAPFVASRFSELFEGRGWVAVAEPKLFSEELAHRVGFNPRPDLLLTAHDGSKLAIEFEISRADPVANHAKFHVAWQRGALGPRDAFLSMMSGHIDHGRRSLGAAFAQCMRSDGLAAFQTSLLPASNGSAVRALNRLPRAALERAALPLRREFERALAVAVPLIDSAARIHFAGDPADVFANAWEFNRLIHTDAGALWSNRPTQYFVVDPYDQSFAPSKFCAFVPSRLEASFRASGTMTAALYSSLDESEPRFDGRRAWEHLVSQLGFARSGITAEWAPAWERWRARVGERVRLRGETVLLVPPARS